MPRTVSDGFSEFLTRIEPNQTEVNARKSHKRTIEQALGGAFKKFNRLEIIGSHTRDTAIRYHSDVDYLAVLGKEDVSHGGYITQSSTVLKNVRDVLADRFKSTDVRIDGPAVVVRFQGGEGAVDVVPGYWKGTTGRDGYPLFAIPDATGGWIDTAPQRHGKYLGEREVASGYKLSRVVRLLKAWKYARSPKIPFLAFHVEILLASDGLCDGVKGYGTCLRDAFRRLRDRKAVALNDPLALSGRIPIVYTDVQAIRLVNYASHAANHADSALDAEYRGDMAEAFRQWRIVFNDAFPARR